MEDAFGQMNDLTKIMHYLTVKARKSTDPKSIFDEIDELMQRRSLVAKKYVTVSREYHNLCYKKMPI